MRLGHTVQLPVWAIVPIIVVVLGISVVSYQIGQRSGTGEDMTPAGDQGVQAGAAVPRSAGNVHAGDGLLAWANAAAVGDYVTAQQHIEPDHLNFNFWKSDHDAFVRDITGYSIVRRETVGQTTTAVVRFDSEAGPRCITVQLNEQTQQVRADRLYGRCPTS